jgi:hypothetical protein
LPLDPNQTAPERSTAGSSAAARPPMIGAFDETGAIRLETTMSTIYSAQSPPARRERDREITAFPHGSSVTDE